VVVSGIMGRAGRTPSFSHDLRARRRPAIVLRRMGPPEFSDRARTSRPIDRRLLGAPSFGREGRVEKGAPLFIRGFFKLGGRGTISRMNVKKRGGTLKR